MNISPLDNQTKLSGNCFYFAADNIYFDLYGKALALSLLDRAPWSKIHVHFYNQTIEQKDWCERKNISYSNDIIDRDNPEFRTLCACIRFIRIPEIFEQSARIIAFDCDVIAKNIIPKEKFIEDTKVSKVTLRKGNRSLASAITFGNDNFRNDFRDRLLKNFEIDNIYWFLDQDVLDEMLQEEKVATMRSDWGGTKMLDGQMIWTAKGDRKISRAQYQQLIDYYLKNDK
jgi:hypothetical protein